MRSKDQSVDAFSAPKSLIIAATEEAARRGWPKSGFYRYCLAKELGYSEDDATELALHTSIQRVRHTMASSTKYPEHSEQVAHLNDAPDLSEKVKKAADKVEAILDRRATETGKKGKQ
jgi:hypothetical protein